MIAPLITPLIERTMSDVRAELFSLRAGREVADKHGRIVEIRSYDLEIAEATRALAILNRRATEADDARQAEERAPDLAVARALIASLGVGRQERADLERIVDSIAEERAQREADLREAFIAGCQFGVGRVRITDSGAGPSMDTPTVGEEDDAAAEYARAKVGG